MGEAVLSNLSVLAVLFSFLISLSRFSRHVFLLVFLTHYSAPLNHVFISLKLFSDPFTATP